jgi:hypothetical protein
MDVRKDMNMRRKHWREFSIACGFILVTFLCVPGLAIADNRGDVNFIFGTKLLDDGEWGSLDEQDAFGVEVSWGQDSWPFLIAIDLLTSNDDQNILGAKWEGTTREIDVGVRKIWEKGRVRPYIGGGFAFISGEVERTGVGSDDDSAFGARLLRPRVARRTGDRRRRLRVRRRIRGPRPRLELAGKLVDSHHPSVSAEMRYRTRRTRHWMTRQGQNIILRLMKNRSLSSITSSVL